ncbi:hypothetical protein C483_12518 [Natrialba hulunbeirensis JCM 10989]|uniref:Uncharacterized protein n=1 Tax=Natrialba hulunbeirensis JCM 10989 TaxID=1227493 RepID=L9ZVG4_9EURY|nr:hypothetical protein C483_12518 [Natrialba hulunbeirensis JCM 10989]
MERWTTVTVELPREDGTDSVPADAISYGLAASSGPGSKPGWLGDLATEDGQRSPGTVSGKDAKSDEPDSENVDTFTLRNELRTRLGQVIISSACGNLVVKVDRKVASEPDQMVFDPRPVLDVPPDGVDRLLALEFDPEDETVGRLYERDGWTLSLREEYYGSPEHHATDVVADIYREHGFRGGTRSNIDTVIRRPDVALLVRTGDKGVRLRAAQECWERHTYNVIKNPSTGLARNVVQEPFDQADRAFLFEAIEDSTEPTVLRGHALKALAGHVLNPYLTANGSERTDEAVERAIATQEGPITGSFDLGIDPDQAATVLEIIATWLEADTRDDRGDDRTRDATAALWLSPHWDLYAPTELQKRIWSHLDQLGVRNLVTNSAWDGTLFSWPYR